MSPTLILEGLVAFAAVASLFVGNGYLRQRRMDTEAKAVKENRDQRVADAMFGPDGKGGGLLDDVRQIKYEMQPNSGKSLRDAVNAVHEALNYHITDEANDRAKMWEAVERKVDKK